MTLRILPISRALMTLFMLSCTSKNQDQLENASMSLDLTRGEIALCGSENSKFGTVLFDLSCSDSVRVDFNLATAILHSFEYTEAEKVFARVIDKDPNCVMAYWGVAMCNFHPLWEQPSEHDLQKGSAVISVARSLIQDKSTRESNYIEAIATIYDDYSKTDHRTRLLKFEKASEGLYLKYPEDYEAAIFYSLALRAAADPADKTFLKQKKAGKILENIFEKEPNHPGVAHYIIHTYDYPELAETGLPAARKYSSIASASAHAQHMPSHIFTRLGLWNESIQSNLNSVASALCYAENTGIKGHWDEELHGLDYLVYAYLQNANDAKALEQVQYLNSITEVFPQNFKVGYSFAAIPTRYAVERKDWAGMMKLELHPSNFPWQKMSWEKANFHFGKLLAAVHSEKLDVAKSELEQLKILYDNLNKAKEGYKSNLVMIQIKASEGWIKLAEGEKKAAIALMMEAADMEDATEKHPVTPGEIIPARELLGEMYLQMEEPSKALQAFEASLARHPNRFNGLYGAGLAAERSRDYKKAEKYYKQILAIADSSCDRKELLLVKSFLKIS